jgi:hypothetical protein
MLSPRSTVLGKGKGLSVICHKGTKGEVEEVQLYSLLTCALRHVTLDTDLLKTVNARDSSRKEHDVLSTGAEIPVFLRRRCIHL